MGEVARVGGGRVVSFAGYEVVGNDEGLAWAEVAGVVEGDRLGGGYGLALGVSVVYSRVIMGMGIGGAQREDERLPLLYATASGPKPSTYIRQY